MFTQIAQKVKQDFYISTLLIISICIFTIVQIFNCEMISSYASERVIHKMENSDISADVKKVKNYKHCTIVTDLSSDKLIIKNSFRGKKVTVFGTKSCSDSKVILIVRGMSEKIQIKDITKYVNSRKVKNSKLMYFDNIPSIYLLQTKHSIKDILDNNLIKQFLIGIDSLDIQLLQKGKNFTEIEVENAIQEIKKYKVQNKLFLNNEKDKKSVIESQYLFKGNFTIPKSIRPGVYLFETVLIGNKGVYSVSIDPFVVFQSNIGTAIRDLSIQNKMLYYSISVTIASGLGIISFAIFNVINILRLKRKGFGRRY